MGVDQRWLGQVHDGERLKYSATESDQQSLTPYRVHATIALNTHRLGQTEYDFVPSRCLRPNRLVMHALQEDGARGVPYQRSVANSTLE
jgi:hypothetical protein